MHFIAASNLILSLKIFNLLGVINNQSARCICDFNWINLLKKLLQIFFRKCNFSDCFYSNYFILLLANVLHPLLSPRPSCLVF